MLSFVVIIIVSSYFELELKCFSTRLHSLEREMPGTLFTSLSFKYSELLFKQVANSSLRIYAESVWAYAGVCLNGWVGVGLEALCLFPPRVSALSVGQVPAPAGLPCSCGT